MSFAIPNHLKPHLYGWTAFFFTAALVSSVKALHGAVPVPLIIAMRSLVGLVCLGPLIRRQGGWRATLKTNYPKHQAIRGLCGIVALSLNFYALPQLPLADAQGLSQLYPIFLVVLAPFILGEFAGWRQWLALMVGLSGALLIIQPQGQSALIPTFCVMGSAVVSAGGDLLARLMGRHDSPLTITVWLLTILGVVNFALWLGLYGVTPLNLYQILILLQIGVVGAAAQFFLSQGFKFLPAATMATYSSLGLVWAVIFGYVCFYEVPGWWFVGGAVLILFAVWIASYTRPARAPVPTPTAETL